jgi:hypothetical protein
MKVVRCLNLSNKYSYEKAWDYLVTMLNGVSQISDTVKIDKMQEIMFNLERRIDGDDTE